MRRERGTYRSTRKWKCHTNAQKSKLHGRKMIGTSLIQQIDILVQADSPITVMDPIRTLHFWKMAKVVEKNKL